MTEISKAWWTVVAGLACAGTLAAQAEYFPMDRGDVRIFRSQSSLRTVTVGDYQTFGKETYFRVTGMPLSDGWLRVSADGTLYGYDEAAAEEHVMVRFGAAEGEAYEAVTGPCRSVARIVSRKAKYSGPIGSFDNALEIAYSEGECRDAGLVREIYLPWVGLIEQTVQSVAGPRTYQLIYARLGGVTVISARELTFQLTIDRAVYVVDMMPPVDPAAVAPVALARIALRHSQPQPLTITFASGQTYEIVLRNEAGEEVWRWSAGKAFTDALRTEEFPAGERNWTEAVTLASRDGKPLPAGKYVAEAWLVTPGLKAFSASVGFEIRYVY